jgi:integrase
MIIQIINNGGLYMKTIDYSQVKINGLHYVREVNDELGDRGGYLLIDNKNRPVKDVYKFLKRRKKKHGDGINSLKRICYDLCYFYDYMLVNNIDIELLTYEYFYDFIDRYLKIMDPNFKVTHSIDRSRLKKIHTLPLYQSDNIQKVKPLDQNKVGGLTPDSIRRIANNTKIFLLYLHDIENRNINIDDIFVEKIVNVDRDNSLLGHIQTGKKIVFSITGVLKAAKIAFKTKREPNPISSECVFEDTELEKMFLELKKDKNIMYYLFFYLLKVSGMRISEARALKIWKCPRLGLDIKFDELESDIRLVNKDESVWEVNIKVRNDNPKDLQIKGMKERIVYFIDSEKVFESLLRQALIYRNYKMRQKKKEHNFLFINRDGNRFLNARIEQKFNEIMKAAGLEKRLGRGQLVIHSLRHTYASKWVSRMKANNADVELNYLSKALGHSNSTTTRKIYLHFFKEELIEVLKAMEKASRLEKGGDD